jgi:oxygen-independent coproporphyrinogen-3 oxidase
MLGIYLHIPFCEKICSYCNFNRGLDDPALRYRYVEAVEREIVEAGDGRVADTVFFGGGTPSLLDPHDVQRLIKACRTGYHVTPDAEITLEANPESVTPEKLDGLLAAGVNRLSLGVQSFDDDELRRLGRLHSAARAAEAFAMARAAGFVNISLDLMCWLPGQSLDSWLRTLDRAIALGPDHLSLYLLEIYPNAPLRDAMARGSGSTDWAQTPDDDAADMYLDGLAALDKAGYGQYEISNVARIDRASRHNLKYWTAGSWRGFGCGAHSTVDGLRWRNLSSTTDYVEHVRRGGDVGLDRVLLSASERMTEALFMGLRLAEGVDRRACQERFGVDPWREYGESLAPFVEERLVWVSAGRMGLSRRGMLVANEILSVFV